MNKGIRILLMWMATVNPGLACAGCLDAASERYGVDGLLLKSISYVESRFNNLATHKNTNGSIDFCAMQVNSIHLPFLAQYGITKETLLSNECRCHEVGAWLYSRCEEKFGKTWQAVGCYVAGPNSKNIDAQLAYIQKVKAVYSKLSKEKK